MALKDAIKHLQTELNLEGATLTVDGIFGPKTEAALKWALAKKPAPVPSTGMRPIDWLRGELGQKEIKGKQDNPRIRWYHKHSANIGSKEHPDEVPWCSSILNAAADETGYEKTDNALASSWDKYGEPCGDWVEEGDIVTIAQPGRHVTLANKRFNRKTDKTFEGIGGNQGNACKVSVYNTSTIKACRKWQPLSAPKEDTSKNPLAPAVEMIKKFEGFRSEAYQDVVGVWTIGFGTTRDVNKGDTCTMKQAEEWLIDDMIHDRLPVIEELVTVPLNDNQTCALISFCYNVGNGAFGKSTLLKKINAEASATEIRAEFAKWNKAGGKIYKGLIRRREAEADLFFS